MSISVHDILILAGQEFGVSRLDLLSPRRASQIVMARIAVYGLARCWTSKSYPQIGKVLERDHTTVLYGARRFEHAVRTDPDFSRHVRRIEIVLAYLSMFSARHSCFPPAHTGVRPLTGGRKLAFACPATEGGAGRMVSGRQKP